MGNINSGYTLRDGPLGVIRDPWGNVELLTLTLSFPSNRKRYNWELGIGNIVFVAELPLFKD
jgi:hypothetical protein